MRKLYRSKRRRLLGGVCGGIGEMFNIDATLVRLLVVLLSFFTGFLPIFAIYLISWLIIPLHGEADGKPLIRRFYRSKGNRMISGICGGIGEMLGVDPVIVRLVVVFLCLVTLLIPLSLIYLIMWLSSK